MNRLPVLLVSILFLFPTLTAQGQTPGASGSERAPLSLEVTLSAEADLGTARFILRAIQPDRPAVAYLQLFLERAYTDANGRQKTAWVSVRPLNEKRQPIPVKLYPEQTYETRFEVEGLGVGKYGRWRVVLFEAESNYTRVLYDSAGKGAPSPLGLEIQTTKTRIRKPRLEVDFDGMKIESGKLLVPYLLKWPSNYLKAGSGHSGLWWQMKSELGFQQLWVSGASKNAQTAEGPDPYRFVSGNFSLPEPTKPGIYRLEYGLFTGDWKPISWNNDTWPPYEFEYGDWVQRCPKEQIPPRIAPVSANGRVIWREEGGREFSQEKAPFLIGGNYGNAFCWTSTPAGANRHYFGLLKWHGLRFLRIHFDADRALKYPVYRHRLEQYVHEMLKAGVYPIIAPQSLPSAEDRDMQADLLESLWKLLTPMFASLPVWFDLVNEPHQYSKWSELKPVVQRCAEAIRKADPKALIIVPLPGWNNRDTESVARDPLPAGLVNLYGLHTYMSPEETSQRLEPLLRAGLPTLIKEYHVGGQPGREMHLLFQNLQRRYGHIAGIAAWAWTTQDGIRLVQDLSSPALRLTSTGEFLLNDYALWRKEGTLPPVYLPSVSGTPTRSEVAARSGQTPTPGQFWSEEELVDLLRRILPALIREQYGRLVNEEQARAIAAETVRRLMQQKSAP